MAESTFWAHWAHRLGRPFRRAAPRLPRQGHVDGAGPDAAFIEASAALGGGSAGGRTAPPSPLTATQALRTALPDLLRRHQVGVVFDAPCGDFHWMKTVSLPEGVSYIGADIVAPMVARLAQVNAAPGRQFLHLDITTGPFPRHDLWLCRDCLTQFSYADIARALRAFLASHGRLAMLTSFTGSDGQPVVNQDVSTGEARPIDLTAAPFNLPLPIEAVDDTVAPLHPRVVGLWTREQIAEGARAFLEQY